jgi:hypothetical protein
MKLKMALNSVSSSSAAPLAKFASYIITSALALFVLILVLNSFSVIAPGNTGVIFNVWTGALRSVP